MNNIALLIKPASYTCNLNCTYCFYKSTNNLYEKATLMTLETLEELLMKTFEIDAHVIQFIWQGGEPTLMGLDFFKEVVRLQKALKGNNQVIENSFQTNGILIDESWCRFFKEEGNWLIGISLDGPEDIHDHYRIDYNGNGTFSQVMSAINLLKKNGVPFNILILLNDVSVKQPERIWKFFKKENFSHLQFINCFEWDENIEGLTDFSVKGEEVGSFYIKLFDLWLKEGFPRVSIRLFEDILMHHFQNRHGSCSFLPNCASYLVVEHNGDVYPCDFFVKEEYKLGNVSESPLIDFLQKPKRFDFHKMKENLVSECLQCTYKSFCNGDCIKFRQTENNKDFRNISEYCVATKMLMKHIESQLSIIEEYLYRIEEGQVNRNDPCPCGSGIKYKRCCG